VKSIILGASLLALVACGEEEKAEGMTAGDCTDGADNDGDGDFDCNDDRCAGSSDCSGTNDTGLEDTGGTVTSGDPNVDDDGDGVSENDGDCDDSDVSIYPGASDATVDGVDQDCNNFDGPDADGDGYAPESAGGTDCDDGDASMPNDDMDCDGVLTVDDCDDGDASTVNDMDCDGVLTVDDCDDGDPSTVNDMDCDGVLTVDDCDDGDASTVNDMDCDGVLTVDDCDDGDPSTVNDMDCDGVLTVDDCNDGDANVVSVCVELSLGGGQSMDLVMIPSGSDPQGRYTITSDFYLMTTEVTQGMFAALMGYNAHDGQPTSDSNGSYGIGNDYPAYYVNWHMAADFANKVTQRHNSLHGTSLQECYNCSNSGSSTSVICTATSDPYQCTGYVLPTEAEWEYAARSGSQYKFWTEDGGGNYSASACNGTETIQDGVSNPLLRDYAWYCGNLNNAYGANGSKEVGQKLPNGFGLYDMHGNVREWTADWYGPSFPQASTDPYCGSAGSERVLRGGVWNYVPVDMQAAMRSSVGPTYRYNGVGFRLGLHP